MLNFRDLSTGFSRLAACSIVALMLTPTISIAKVKGKNQTVFQSKAKYKQRHSFDDALYADGIKIKKDLFMIDQVQMERATKADAIPADRLYGGVWNNNYVDCYKSEEMPDSFRVNLRGFTMPVTGNMTSNFGYRWGRHHYGVDLQLHTGDTVYAAFTGKVRICRYEPGGYGNFVTIRHANGLETVYGHLSRFLVSDDQTVKSGQPIALGGSTGRSTGPHLHFETRFMGKAIDPNRIIDFENQVCNRDYYVVNANSFNPLNSSSRTLAHYKGGSNKYERGSIRTHRVRGGQTLAEIARSNGTTVKKLCKLNGISKHSKLRKGKVLRVK